MLNSRISLAVGTEAIASIAGPQAEFAQHARAVGRDLHAGAEFAQFGGLLVQRDVEAPLQQRERGDDAADAGAGDQDAWLAQVPSPVRWRDLNRERRLDASGRMNARSTQSQTRRTADGIAVAAASPCLCGEGPGGEPALHRGHPGHSPGRHLVRAHVPPGGRPRGGLLPHLLRDRPMAARWRSSSSPTTRRGRRTGRSCRMSAGRGMSRSR